MLIDGKTIAYQIDHGHWTAHRQSVPIMSGDLKIGTNSVDVTLGDHLLALHSEVGLDPMDSKTVSWQRNDPYQGRFLVLPGTLYLGYVRERFDCSQPIRMSDRYTHLTGDRVYERDVYCVPMIDGRSTLARLGLSVHETAGFGDYGFSGNFTLEICATMPMFLTVGMRIAQISFEEVSAGVSGYRYAGAYTDHIDRPVPPVLGPDRF